MIERDITHWWPAVGDVHIWYKLRHSLMLQVLNTKATRKYILVLCASMQSYQNWLNLGSINALHRCLSHNYFGKRNHRANRMQTSLIVCWGAANGKPKAKEKEKPKKERKMKKDCFFSPRAVSCQGWADENTTFRWRFSSSEPEGPKGLDKTWTGGYLCGLFYFWLVFDSERVTPII